jgi:hypothetical protein
MAKAIRVKVSHPLLEALVFTDGAGAFGFFAGTGVVFFAID